MIAIAPVRPASAGIRRDLPVAEIDYPICQVDECGIVAASKIKRSEIARRTTMRQAVERNDHMRREATALDLVGYT